MDYVHLFVSQTIGAEDITHRGHNTVKSAGCLHGEKKDHPMQPCDISGCNEIVTAQLDIKC